MPGLIALGAALTAAALTGPVMAAPSAPRPAPRPVLAAPATPAKMTSAEGAAYLLALQSAGAATFEEAKALLQQALALVPQPGLMRGRLACTLAARTYSQSVDDAAYNQEAASTASECYRLRPDDAQAQMLDGVAKLGIGRVREGGLQLLAAIRAEPGMLAAFDEIAAMKRTFRQLGYAGETGLAGELRQELVKTGWGKEDPEFFGRMALQVIADKLARGARADAIATLPEVLDPDTGLQLLIDRRFAPIWPEIEEWAGANLRRQRDANLAVVRGQFQADPSLARRRFLADALWNSGQRAEARALLAQAIDDPALWDEDRFYISLMTSQYAKMLLFGGNVQEAIAVATRVNAANPVAQYPYAMNLMPNFTLLLIQAGRERDALALLDRETPSEQVLESPAAFGFYVALRYCAYQRLSDLTGTAALAAPVDPGLAVTAASAATGPAPASAAPAGHDFAALVDRLIAARDASRPDGGPQGVNVAVNHAEFGQVSLNFRHGADGLTVSVASPDPDFARAVQAATTAPATGGNDGFAQSGQSSGGQSFGTQSSSNQSGAQSQPGGQGRAGAATGNRGDGPATDQTTGETPARRRGLFA